MQDVCTIKTIDDMIKELEKIKEKIGGDAAVIMSQDEEGNSYGDILMMDADTTKQFLQYCECDYRGDDKDPALKASNKNPNVLIIYPNL